MNKGLRKEYKGRYGIGGLMCRCCNDFYNRKYKSRLNRITRHAQKDATRREVEDALDSWENEVWAFMYDDIWDEIDISMEEYEERCALMNCETH